MRSPRRVIWGGEGDRIYSIADLNGIFEWSFYGNPHYDMLEVEKHYENVEEKNRVDKEGTMKKKDTCMPSELLRELRA
jgi:hypothetical protein